MTANKIRGTPIRREKIFLNKALSQQMVDFDEK